MAASLRTPGRRTGGSGSVPPTAAAGAGSTSLAGNLYASALLHPSSNPRESYQIMQDRLKRARKFNEELSDYFSARRELEEAYLRALSKLTQSSSSSSKNTFLTVLEHEPDLVPQGFKPVYQRLLRELDEQGRIRGELSSAVARECEHALQQISTAPASSTGGASGGFSAAATEALGSVTLQKHDTTLERLLKELSTLDAQLAKESKKLDAKSDKSRSQAQQRVAETQEQIDQAQIAWRQASQEAFIAYQQADRARLNVLKESVVRFETAHVEAAQRSIQLSEQGMVAAVEFDVEAEMQGFALKAGDPRAVEAAARSAAGAGTGVSAGDAGMLPGVLPPSAAVAQARKRSGTNDTVEGRGKPAVPDRLNRTPSTATSRSNRPDANIGGASTYNQRSRSEMPPPPLPTSRATVGSRGDGLPSSSGHNEFGSGAPGRNGLPSSGSTSNLFSSGGAGARGSSRTDVNQQNDAASSIHSREFGAGDTSYAATTGGNTTSSGGGGAASKLRSAFARFGRKQSNTNKDAKGDTYGNLGDDSYASRSGANDSTIRASSNARAGAVGGAAAAGAAGAAGAGLLDDNSDLLDDAPLGSSSQSGAYSGGAGRSAGGSSAAAAAPRLQEPLMPSRAGSGSAAASKSPANGTSSSPFHAPQQAASQVPQVDEEGYSIAPPDRKPWDVAGANLDDEEDNDVLANLGTNSRMSTMNITSSPAPPVNSAEDQAALEKMRAALGAPAKAPARRSTTSRRDRRDVRNTTYSPTLDDNSRPVSQFGLPQLTTAGLGAAGAGAAAGGLAGGGFTSSPIASPISATPGQGLTAATDGRTQSMLSNASAARAAAVDPFATAANLSAAGISAAITETVNALFSGKELQKLMVVGEVVVSLKDVDPSTESVHLRIDAFEQLEKVAPNPAFITAIHGRAGEYKLDVASMLAQSSGTGDGTTRGTIFKYQVHVSEDAVRQKSWLPLEVAAQWRCEDHQTSLLLSYTPNSESRLIENDQSGAASLKDLSFVVGIGPTDVTSVMSKPSGVWSADSRKIQWNVSEPVALGAGSSAQKILARFQVAGKSTPAPVGVRWSVVGATLSQLGLEIVQESNEAPSRLQIAETARRCVAGKYLAGP